MTLKRNAWGRYVEETKLAKSLRRLNLQMKKPSSKKPPARRKPTERTIYRNKFGRELMGPLQWRQYPDEY